MIIAISGTPCTGKTSVAEALGERIGYKVIHLNKLAEEMGFYCGYDEKRECKIVDIEKVKKEIKRIFKRYKNIIIESHYSHCIPSDVVIILRCNPKELRNRMELRGWNKKKIDENIEAEIMEICKTEALEMGKNIVEVDTTGKKIERVVEEIIKYI